MLLGYSFEPRPNSRVLATADSVMIIGFSINGYAHSKNQFDEREQEWLGQKFSVATLKFCRDSGRATFSPLHSRRQKKALLAGWVIHCAKEQNSHQNGSYHTSNVQRAKRHTIIIKHNFLHPKLSRPPFLNRATKIIARAPWNGGPQQDGKFAGRLIFKRCFTWITSTENLKYIMENVHDQLHFDRFFLSIQTWKNWYVRRKS